jgi:hypothetical protein
MAGFLPGQTPERDFHLISFLSHRSGGRYETMYVELGALSELRLEVSQGDLVHHLSRADVDNAFGLAKYGYQQLREILEPGSTFFEFTLRPDGHTTTVVVYVRQESGYSKSNVVGAYRSCCPQAPNERIRADIATVYNFYIRVDRQTFDDAWCDIPSSLIRLRWS